MSEMAKAGVRISTALDRGRCDSKSHPGEGEPLPGPIGGEAAPPAYPCQTRARRACFRRTREGEPSMAKGIRFHETGGPEVLRWESLPVGEPGPGEVRIRHAAVGLNFADTYFRTGLYPAPLPAGMGVEAAGVIEAVGPGVTGFAEGDRVTYTGSPLGAYSTERVMDVAPLIKLPDTIPFETAAAMTMRGLTTSYLLRRIADLKAGDTVLLHAAAGGVGLLFSQWARLLGVNVIGTVSTDEKAEIARAHGCTHTIVYTREDVAARVRDLTDGAGVPVAYDSIGRTTVPSSLDSLSRRGLLVCFGTASGPIPPIDAMQLAVKGS